MGGKKTKEERKKGEEKGDRCGRRSEMRRKKVGIMVEGGEDRDRDNLICNPVSDHAAADAELMPPR